MDITLKPRKNKHLNAKAASPPFFLQHLMSPWCGAEESIIFY